MSNDMVAYFLSLRQFVESHLHGGLSGQNRHSLVFELIGLVWNAFLAIDAGSVRRGNVREKEFSLLDFELSVRGTDLQIQW